MGVRRVKSMKDVDLMQKRRAEVETLRKLVRHGRMSTRALLGSEFMICLITQRYVVHTLITTGQGLGDRSLFMVTEEGKKQLPIMLAARTV